MTCCPFRAAGDDAPSPHDGVAHRKDSPGKARGETVAHGDMPWSVRMIVVKIVNAFVIFGESQDAEKIPAFVLCGRPGLHGRRAAWIDDRGTFVSRSQPITILHPGHSLVHG